MSSQIKISANTSEVKKSLLDLSKDVKNVGKTKVSIFSESDRKFIKEELGKELSLMKSKLAENRGEISKLVSAAEKLQKGSKEELATRKKIIEAYRVQTKLAGQIGTIQKQQKGMGGFGGIGGTSTTSGLPGTLAKIGGLLGGVAIAVGAAALLKGYQSNEQFKQGASNRVKLRGLGMEATNMGVGAEELARAGLTEQDYITRQRNAVSRLGREGGAKQSIMQQAKFERAFGLDEGAMTNISTSLRATMGGKGADQTQLKLQASIFASGIEDALAPYLEATTSLLSDINQNGLTNTDELINVMSQMVKDGQRTPEMLAEAFKGIDAAVKGSSGEANAFFQTAFARGGIGGGTIGSTRLAMSSGGIFGLSEEELAKRGYNKDLIQNMKGAGFTKGLGGRSDAILNQFKSSGGMGKGQKFSDIKDINQMTALATLANSTLGTQGDQGFDALLMLEKVQNKQMTQKQFESKLQDLREGKDPQLDRLNKINSSLEGQTEILQNINTNLMEALGKTTVKVGNAAVQADNLLTGGMVKTSDYVQSEDFKQKISKINNRMTKAYISSRVGDSAVDMDMLEDDAAVSKKGNVPGSLQSAPAPAEAAKGQSEMAKAVEDGMTRALDKQKAPVVQNNNKINVRVQTPDGRVSNKTHR